MTVASQTNRISYTGNGATTAFAVSFPFQSANDLVVVETIIATGVQTTKTITTHYTVSGTPDSLGYYPNGGTVTAVTAPASTVTWTIYRAPALLQMLNLAENNALPAESLEAQLDYLTMLVQRLNDRVNRSVRQPDGDSADIAVLPSKVTRASKYIAFDAAGDPIATTGTTEANPVSAFMATVLDDTTASAARTTLSAVGVGENIAFPATQAASADPNTLDDYEEGLWTPSVGGTATYSQQVGRYTKIGRVVYISCLLQINVLGTGSTSQISGLPFAVAAGPDYGAAVADFNGLATAVTWLAGRIDASNSTITLRDVVAANASATSSVLFQNATIVALSGFYFV